MRMSFSAPLAAGPGALALLYAPFNHIIWAFGILGYPDRGKVSVRVAAVEGLTMTPGGLCRLPSCLGHRGTRFHHDEKVNYLGGSFRETCGRLGLPG